MQTIVKPRGWFNVTEAAYYLNISRPTFYKWSKDIPHALVDGIRRWSKEDLDKFMNDHKR